MRYRAILEVVLFVWTQADLKGQTFSCDSGARKQDAVLVMGFNFRRTPKLFWSNKSWARFGPVLASRQVVSCPLETLVSK